jgi:hypothetical protein
MANQQVIPAALILVSFISGLNHLLILKTVIHSIHAFVSQTFSSPPSILGKLIWVSVRISQVSLLYLPLVINAVFQRFFQHTLNHIQLNWSACRSP